MKIEHLFNWEYQDKIYTCSDVHQSRASLKILPETVLDTISSYEKTSLQISFATLVSHKWLKRGQDCFPCKNHITHGQQYYKVQTCAKIKMGIYYYYFLLKQ